MTDPYMQWNVPARLARLKDLAYNLWWSWHPEARALFKSVDLTLWRSTHHNPVLLLQKAGQARLEQLANDPAFLAKYDAVTGSFDKYLKGEETWFKKAHPEFDGKAVAYFSAEFGVHNSLRIYSGGLGILAGDHCKTASDLGVPLYGIGFMYPQGYVQQRIGSDGWQQNVYDQIDWNTSPVRPVTKPNGERFIFDLNLGSWQLHVAVWEVTVGRVKLLLMDTNVDGNSAADREISGRLYGGDRSMRLRQEIVLGIGGIRLLRALGVPAAVYHANEGHASFLHVELLREAVAAGKPIEQAKKDVIDRCVFTTHTPVEAGHDVFNEELVAEYFRSYWPALGLDQNGFLELGRSPGEHGWNMTSLGLRLSGKRNGVSKRHGLVSKQMWHKLWPNLPVEEVPIDYVTNGVHLQTWVNQEMAGLFARHLGEDWAEKQDDQALWSKAAAIPDEELWRVHNRNKRELFKLLRNRARVRWASGQNDPTQVLAGGALFDPDALTIGFARRFAGYKRANLLLRDLDRLKRLLLDEWRPVQLLFAGKAHPADDGGKFLIQQVYRLARDPQLAGRIAFVEDYDMHVARYLVQGCDVWLNNPVAPLEACGTSGQKAGANGVPNLSILDGWWEEGFNGSNGWGAGTPGGKGGGDQIDNADATEIFEIIERKVVPLYYNDRSGEGLPRGWVKVMRESIRSVAPRFCGSRMVKEYVDRMYSPVAVAHR